MVSKTWRSEPRGCLRRTPRLRPKRVRGPRCMCGILDNMCVSHQLTKIKMGITSSTIRHGVFHLPDHVHPNWEQGKDVNLPNLWDLFCLNAFLGVTQKGIRSFCAFFSANLTNKTMPFVRTPLWRYRPCLWSRMGSVTLPPFSQTVLLLWTKKKKNWWNESQE